MRLDILQCLILLKEVNKLIIQMKKLYLQLQQTRISNYQE